LEEALAAFQVAVERFPDVLTGQVGLASIDQGESRPAELATTAGFDVDSGIGGRPLGTSNWTHVDSAGLEEAVPSTKIELQPDELRVSDPRPASTTVGESDHSPPNADDEADEEATSSEFRFSPDHTVQDLALRAAALRARHASSEDRERLSRGAIELAERAILERGTSADALFTKIEVLLSVGDFAEARAVFASVPNYIASRPEFLALEARAALESIRDSEESRQYSQALVDTVVVPSVHAAEKQPVLRMLPVVARLRATAAMSDGAQLDHERAAGAVSIRRVLERDIGSSDSHSPVRALYSWHRDSIRKLLQPAIDGEQDDPESIALYLESRASDLDMVEEELVDAARYMSIRTY
jgi:hypothetical protein